MYYGLYTVDFHTHLQDGDTQLTCCAEDRDSRLYKLLEPVIQQLAEAGEPICDRLVRFWALNWRGEFSRRVYARLGKVGLMEVLRLFRTYSLERLLERMDRNSIDHAVVHSIEPLTRTANIIELVRPHRERLSVFASVDRDNPDPGAYLSPFLDAGEIAGIKIHPIVGRYACGELLHRTEDIVSLAAENGLPVLIHTGHIPVDELKGLGGCSEVEALEPLVRRFPSVQFVLAHIGWESWRKVLALAERYPNTHVETSWQPARIIRRAADRLGSHRVLFGSDFPLYKQRLALDHVAEALSARELVDVLSVNALRLLKLEGLPGRVSQTRSNSA